MIAKFLNSLIDHPYVVMFAALVVTAFACSRIVDLPSGRSRLTVDSSIKNLLPEEGPALQIYEDVLERFGNDDALIVVWLTDDFFSPGNLSALKRLTDRLERIEGVVSVDSLASATYVRAEDDFTDISPFLDTLPETMAEAQALKADALGNPLFAGSLVSRDGRGAAIAVHFDRALDTAALSARIDEVAAASSQEAGEMRQFVTGPIVARLETGRTLFADLKRVFPLAVLVTVFVSMLGLRSIYGVLLPLVANGVSLLVTLATFVYCGNSLNFVTIIMPPVIFIVGFAYAVHVVTDFQKAYADGREKVDAIKHSLNDVFMPLTLTAFTTGIGFTSLTLSNIESIKIFGMFSAFGTLLSWFCAVALVPVGIRLLPLRRPRPASQQSILEIAAKLARFNLDRRKLVFVASSFVAVVSLIGATKISVGTDYLNNFPADHEIRKNFAEVGRVFSGAVPLQIVIESDVPNVFKNPEELRELDKLQVWLQSQPEIGDVVSFVDYMRMLHLTFVPDVMPEEALPATYSLSDQLLALGEGAERFADPRYKSTVMRVRSTAVGTDELSALVHRIEGRLAQLPAHLRGKVTGSSVLLAQTMNEITRGQVVSLSGALVVIYLILSVLFGSLRVGAVALIPNILPIIIFFGILGWTGITLNLATSLVATVALGIAVDDSIHYFSRFNAESRRLADEQLGVERALAAVIRPVTLTTASLCAGFMALLVSDLRNQVEFGVLAAATLAAAWLIDLTLSPALSSGLRFVTLWEVLTVDLGTDPHKKISLFRGLTSRQARIAALFGRIEAYRPGDRILALGEAGNEFCILIEGYVVAQIPGPAGDRVIHALHPGDVFGEVALFTGTRSANIDAVTDVRVLWLNQESLERIRSRYPKIAAWLFWNLSSTVSKRLAEITARV